MTIQVAARGIVARAPEPVETADGEPAAAFLMVDAQFGRYADQVIDLERAPVCEVIVRGPATDPVLRAIQPGAAVLAVVPRQVVQSGDGRDLADGGVGSVLIVEVQPGGEGCSAG